jgi:hypothetical protein
LTKGHRSRKQISDANLHYYARAIKSFSHWLWCDRRVGVMLWSKWNCPRSTTGPAVGRCPETGREEPPPSLFNCDGGNLL